MKLVAEVEAGGDQGVDLTNTSSSTRRKIGDRYYYSTKAGITEDRLKCCIYRIVLEFLLLNPTSGGMRLDRSINVNPYGLTALAILALTLIYLLFGSISFSSRSTPSSQLVSPICRSCLISIKIKIFIPLFRST